MSSSSRLRRILRRYVLPLGLGLVVTVVALGSYLWWLDRTGNFGVIVAGEAYRSGQVYPDTIRRYRDQYGIASILSLRRPAPGERWYDDEVRTSAELGIAHADFAMSSGHMLPAEQAEDLVALMRSLPKPILIHCEQGANRTGLASALYLGVIKDTTERVAEEQLSLRYGHLAISWPESVSPMYATFEALEKRFEISDEPGGS